LILTQRVLEFATLQVILSGVKNPLHTLEKSLT
jgi:hypothetical protein